MVVRALWLALAAAVPALAGPNFESTHWEVAFANGSYLEGSSSRYGRADLPDQVRYISRGGAPHPLVALPLFWRSLERRATADGEPLHLFSGRVRHAQWVTPALFIADEEGGFAEFPLPERPDRFDALLYEIDARDRYFFVSATYAERPGETFLVWFSQEDGWSATVYRLDAAKAWRDLASATVRHFSESRFELRTRQGGLLVDLSRLRQLRWPWDCPGHVADAP